MATTSASGTRGALWTLTALALGLAIGVGVSYSGSGPVMRIVSWLEPIGTLWVNAIRMTVIPLIVASLIVAVAGAEPRTVGRLGTRAFVIFFLLLAVVACMTAFLAPRIFDFLAIDPAAAASIRSGVPAVERPEMPGFISWIVGMVPINPVRAAADGAMLPLVVFSLAFGLALGKAGGPARNAVVGFFGGAAEAMTLLVQWILLLAPIGVFSLALLLATRMGTGVVGAVGFYIAVHSALLLLAVVLLYLVIVAGTRVPIRRFARAALPAQVVAVTTRSSMAALPALLTSAQHTLLLPNTVTSFALPLASSTFRLNQSVTWVVVALFAGKLYGIDLELAQVATIAITSVLVSFSVPGIPSASLFIIAPILASVGIPSEAVGVLIAIDLIPDVFKTLCNVTGHLAAVTLLSRFHREDEAG